MTAIKCPSCDVPLDAAVVKDGWCPECGKPIPRFALRANEPSAEALQRRADIRIFVIFAILMPVGVALGVLEGMAVKGQLGSAKEPVLHVMLCVYVGMFVLYMLNLVLNGKTGHPPLGD